MCRDSRSPHTSAKQLINSRARFSSFVGISCTLIVSSRLYFAVLGWSAVECVLWLRSDPPNIRKTFVKEGLPQTVHTSCGLLLMVSQSTHNTALRRGTACLAFAPSVSAPAFIIRSSQLERCSHAKFCSYNSSEPRRKQTKAKPAVLHLPHYLYPVELYSDAILPDAQINANDASAAADHSVYRQS